MNKHFSGNIALICPDCSTPLVNLAPRGERYHCADCDLRVSRDGDGFALTRFDQVVGRLEEDEAQFQVIWRQLASAV